MRMTLASILLFAATSTQAADVLVPPGPDAQERLAEALIGAAEGDTIWLGIGRYELTDGL